MPLSNAQLMVPPDGPGVTGAVKAGSGVTIDTATGAVSADLNAFCSKILPGDNITISPDPGLGRVTITANITPDPSNLLPIGTVMTFFQAGAPPRWITESPGTRLLRINSSGGSQGGSVVWDSVFTTQTFSGTVSTGGATISGSTDTVNQTPSGSVSLSGLSLGNTSLSTGQIPAHTHTYRQRDNSDSNKGGQCCVAPPSNSETTATGGNGGHSHSLSGGGSFSGNNMSHNHSVSGSLSGNGSFSGGSFNFNTEYIDMIVCRKLSNPT